MPTCMCNGCEGRAKIKQARRTLHVHTMQEYKEVFEPLLLEECCAQILRGVEEGEVLTPHPCAVATSDSASCLAIFCKTFISLYQRFCRLASGH
eukprot:744898-Pelagomonas_calceolata.AAC.2